MRLHMMNFPTSDVLCPESCNHLVLMPAANKQQETVNKATRRIHHAPLSLSWLVSLQTLWTLSAAACSDVCRVLNTRVCRVRGPGENHVLITIMGREHWAPAPERLTLSLRAEILITLICKVYTSTPPTSTSPHVSSTVLFFGNNFWELF